MVWPQSSRARSRARAARAAGQPSRHLAALARGRARATATVPVISASRRVPAWNSSTSQPASGTACDPPGDVAGAAPGQRDARSAVAIVVHQQPSRLQLLGVEPYPGPHWPQADPLLEDLGAG
jgi:hypothetical protein